ncbi:hypothetical protein H0H92_011463 [Tricholoma furcatifolium]|nr:hypothetical protein H0H92_011463 [Tricholoma furcatifolium]
MSTISVHSNEVDTAETLDSLSNASATHREISTSLSTSNEFPISTALVDNPLFRTTGSPSSQWPNLILALNPTELLDNKSLLEEHLLSVTDTDPAAGPVDSQEFIPRNTNVESSSLPSLSLARASPLRPMDVSPVVKDNKGKCKMTPEENEALFQEKMRAAVEECALLGSPESYPLHISHNVKAGIDCSWVEPLHDSCPDQAHHSPISDIDHEQQIKADFALAVRLEEALKCEQIEDDKSLALVLAQLDDEEVQVPGDETRLSIR